MNTRMVDGGVERALGPGGGPGRLITRRSTGM